MCQCEDLTTCRKLFLTNRVASLYDNEVDSDIVFLVGIESEVWRLPGHKKILSNANPVFRALLEGPLATNKKTIVIEDVESRAFDYLLRYLYGEEVTFQSASTALNTLYAAHKYLCSGLIELCVKYLVKNLNSKNVLEIYTYARLYAVKDKSVFEPSAPEMSTETYDLFTPIHCYSLTQFNNNKNNNINNNNNNNNNNIKNCNVSQNEDLKCIETNSIPFWSEVLVKSCLQHIDDNADEILNQESIEDISVENLKEIVKRDSLKIRSEYTIFLALDRWANRECKRRKLNLNSKNRRFVLGDLIYEIRFPFFTSDEFISGPIQSGLLNQQELTVFSALISKSKNISLMPQKWQPHMDKICRKRIQNENESATSSQKTYLIALEKNRDLQKHYNFFRKIKNKKGKTAKESISSKSFKSDADESERSCIKCFSECLIDILVCLFD